MSQLQDEIAAQARPEIQTEEQSETQFDEGFGLGGEDEGRDTDCEADIREMPGFVPVEKYGSYKPLDGEIGSVEGVRYCCTTVLDPWLDAGAAPAAGKPVESNEGACADVYSRLLTNAYRDSLVWDEFYHVSDQIGVRFGNGTFGKIPAQGATVRIDMQYTDGDTLLLERQYLYPVEEILDDAKVPASLQIEVAETIQNGQAQEPTEEMRRNLHYWSVYNDRLIWDNDYTYYLRRRYPEIVFVRVWGEEEAERLWGSKIEHINKIWVCAYAPRDGIVQDVMNAIAEVPMMCRNFQWYNPEHVTFTLNLTGRVLSDKVLSEVEEDVRAALLRAYGRDSLYRRDRVLISEMYECIYSTGHFEKETGAWFEAIPQGNFEASRIYQMVSLDLENSDIQLAHLT